MFGEELATTAGQIVILNGTPRAGKTSIAHAIQGLMPGLWLNLGLEMFKSATPEPYQPGLGLRPGGERPDLEAWVETLYLAMYDSIAAHSRRGVNVVADTTHHDHYSAPRHILPKCAQLIRELPVLIVGVRCPVDVIMQRRIATWGRGYNNDGTIPDPILRWQRDAHVPGIYDVEVDSSVTTPEDAAHLIHGYLMERRPALAVKQLAALLG
ncbi:MAG: chloramphenicol phosphotransferase [Nocardioidaceae bacterium]